MCFSVLLKLWGEVKLLERPAVRGSFLSHSEYFTEGCRSVSQNGFHTSKFQGGLSGNLFENMEIELLHQGRKCVPVLAICCPSTGFYNQILTIGDPLGGAFSKRIA